MIRRFYPLLHMKWTALSGALLGLALGGAFAPVLSSLWEFYDDMNPVAVFTAEVVSASESAVLIRMSGEKNRSCQFVRVHAYTVGTDGQRSDAAIQRVDGLSNGATRGVGSFGPGVWRIWPRDGGVSVQVFSEHICSGRVVVSKVVDVRIPQ